MIVEITHHVHHDEPRHKHDHEQEEEDPEEGLNGRLQPSHQDAQLSKMSSHPDHSQHPGQAKDLHEPQGGHPGGPAALLVPLAHEGDRQVQHTHEDHKSIQDIPGILYVEQPGPDKIHEEFQYKPAHEKSLQVVLLEFPAFVPRAGPENNHIREQDTHTQGGEQWAEGQLPDSLQKRRLVVGLRERRFRQFTPFVPQNPVRNAGELLGLGFGSGLDVPRRDGRHILTHIVKYRHPELATIDSVVDHRPVVGHRLVHELPVCCHIQGVYVIDHKLRHGGLVRGAARPTQVFLLPDLGRRVHVPLKPPRCRLPAVLLVL
mmetsp:Transcript_133715/g.303298  ORF Transcript_133715/g.303298 Transcript_133715/m.303298 type:complete len:317 (-) Transcript_133715:8-958(-)